MTWQTYDDLSGPDLSAELWEPLSIGPNARREIDATTTVDGGTVTVDVPEFTAADDQNQMMDNTKHVVFSTRRFEIPPRGRARFRVELSVAEIGDETEDYRLGVAAFNVVDTEGGTHMVFDLLATGERMYAEHEVLAVPGEENPFTRVVDAPFRHWRQGDFRDCEIQLNRADGTAFWTVDENLIFEASGLTRLPDSVHIGFGFFTLFPVGIAPGSCRGQGGRASWRNFRFSIDSEVTR